MALQQVEKFKYIETAFSAKRGMQATYALHAFQGLKQEMTAAWALLRQQYAYLACTSSVGLEELLLKVH